MLQLYAVNNSINVIVNVTDEQVDFYIPELKATRLVQNVQTVV